MLFNRKYSLKKQLLASFLVSTAMISTPAVAQHQTDESGDGLWHAFGAYASDYNYCDAVMIGKLWNQDGQAGMEFILNKIQNGLASDVPLYLRDSRNAGNRCTFEEIEYAYENALAIANIWGVGIAQAKAIMTEQISLGNSAYVTNALDQALAGQNSNTPDSSRERAWEAYASSNYGFCDAKMVASLWNTDILEGKYTIGRKIMNGIADDVPYVRQQSYDAGNRCAFEDTEFTYDDAVAFARNEGVNVQQAKLSIAMLRSNGNGHRVLRTAYPQ